MIKRQGGVAEDRGGQVRGLGVVSGTMGSQSDVRLVVVLVGKGGPVQLSLSALWLGAPLVRLVRIHLWTLS